MDPRITYFPVDNGDCSLITLSDNTQIIIDCNTTAEASDENEPSRYDVHAHVLQFGKKLNGKVPHVVAREGCIIAGSSEAAPARNQLHREHWRQIQ